MASTKKIDLGPTGRQVARSLRTFRRRRDDLSVYALSKRLEVMGYRLLPSGITRIEREERRVDVDDLIALSVALDVSPLALLLPGEMEATVSLAKGLDVPAATAWRWATGTRPLPAAWGSEVRDQELRWQGENRPHEHGRWTGDELLELMETLSPVLQAAHRAAEEAGLPVTEVFRAADELDALREGIKRRLQPEVSDGQG